ncbi:MAG: hypothetical protein CL570_00320 [Alphaproteobacteria bacterium]|nr:hypothetical protein [Alphaproteobacteria bacterium]|tara:strand:+ start:12385 stop:13326 length:942 start_codon:yes stop_codon:yes gene_type:complete
MSNNIVSVRVNSPQEAAKALVQHNYAIIKLPKNVLETANNILCDGLTFFQQDNKIKKASASLNILEGYRKLGAEKDSVTGRPDLSESYTTWFCNASNPDIETWARNCQFHQTMSSGLAVYAGFTDEILKALRSEIMPDYPVSDEPVIDIRHLSYLQMNFYRPAIHKSNDRDTVMDPHEDGHILTILKPTKPGLMVAPGELVEMPTSQNPMGIFKHGADFQFVDVAADEAILVPSSPTFYMTGGLIKPLFHGVVNKGDEIRQSLMFFVNPSRNVPLEPWVKNEKNRDVNIHNVVDAVSEQYGQPAISQSIQREL